MSKAKSKKKEAKKAKRLASAPEVTHVSPDRFDEMRAALQARVKASRYRHSLGVSQTAEQLARIYGVDQQEAAVAGLLHDWDKSLTGEQLKRKAKKLKLAGKQVREHATGVLHSWTAAATLRDEFPELSDSVLQAIGRHTCGEVGMSDLDMVVFVADIIEPGRDFPDIAALREAVGQVCLEELFYRTYKANFMYLLSADMVVAPPSLDVYNSLVVAREQRLAEEAAAQAEGSEDAARQSLADEIARREQLAQAAEQQMLLARKAAEERQRVRDEKRAHMQAEHAERFAPEQQSASEAQAAAQAQAAKAAAKAQAEAQAQAQAEAQARAQAIAARAEAVAKAKAEAAKRAQERAAALAAAKAQAEAEAQAKAQAQVEAEAKTQAEAAQAAAAQAVERTPGGARIIPIQ